MEWHAICWNTTATPLASSWVAQTGRLKLSVFRKACHLSSLLQGDFWITCRWGKVRVSKDSFCRAWGTHPSYLSSSAPQVHSPNLPKKKCISEIAWIGVVQSSFIWVSCEKPRSPYCVMLYFLGEAAGEILNWSLLGVKVLLITYCSSSGGECHSISSLEGSHFQGWCQPWQAHHRSPPGTCHTDRQWRTTLLTVEVGGCVEQQVQQTML